jgi:hypothetical protein
MATDDQLDAVVPLNRDYDQPVIPPGCVTTWAWFNSGLFWVTVRTPSGPPPGEVYDLRRWRSDQFREKRV